MKIAVYDSGIGSLSVIKELIEQIPSANLIYLADRKHFPYGKKEHNELKKIIAKTNEYLIKTFNPDLIVLASNTPSIQVLPELEETFSVPVVGVLPPVDEASTYSKTGHIAILATDNTVKSKELVNFINNKHFDPKIKFTFYGISTLVELVESGEFLINPNKTTKIIREHLKPLIQSNPLIDTMTLSSTHLPFLKKYFEKEFPKIKFLDPADKVAHAVKKLTHNINKERGSLEIYVSEYEEFYKKIIKKLGFNAKIKKAYLEY